MRTFGKIILIALVVYFGARVSGRYEACRSLGLEQITCLGYAL